MIYTLPTRELRGTLLGSSTRVTLVDVEAAIPRGTITVADQDQGPQPPWQLPMPDYAQPWMQVFVREVNTLAALLPGWDSYGGAALKEKSAVLAQQLLVDVDFAGPAPWISPTPEGDLHLEWDGRGITVELDISDAGDITLVKTENDDVLETLESLHSDACLAAIQALLDRVASSR